MLRNAWLHVPVAVFLLAGTSVLYSQTPTDNGLSGQGDVNSQSQTGCVDITGLPSANCVQQQQQDQQYTNRFQPGVNGTTPVNGVDLQNTPQGSLLGNQRNRQMIQLPPDQPTEFQRFVAATVGQMLPIYGANLFRSIPATFSPSDLAPASPSYVIEPDDELRVRIWGQVTFSGNLLVDRSGNIYIPNVGSVHVAGQPFSTLDQHLRQAVSRIYRNFDLAVDLGRIRSMQVYLTGAARKPGVYTVSSLSTLVDALFLSGGPSPQGSLRHIELKRDGKVVADFDLYALLIRGDKSSDVQLLPEDVLYIPPAGPQVAITGSIHSPAIYEMREGETVGQLIENAGKTGTIAAQTRISIERMGGGQYRQAMEANFDSAGLATPIADGDIVRIYSIVPAYTKTVVLRGNVANPGRFSWHEGMHLSDIIPDRTSLLTRDYWWQRSHLGLPVPEFEPFINVQHSPDSTEPTNLNPQARPIKPSDWMWPTGNTQSEGNLPIYTQKNSPYNPDNQYGLYGQYGSYNQQYNSQSPTDYQQYLAGVQPQTGNTASQRTTTSSGSLAAGSHDLEQEQPPQQELRRNTVRVTPAGINWNFAVIERMDPDTLKTTLISFDLGKLVLNHDAGQDLALQAGDTITIFSQNDIQIPLAEQIKYIDLEGEFAHSGIYSVLPGETLRDVVRRAGGLTQNAYLYGSEFDRESTRKLQQQRLDEYVRTVSMEASRGTQQLAVTGAGSANTADVQASRAVSQQLVDQLSQIRATGRIVLQFHPASQGLDSVPALALENGDRFTVPSAPATVNVVGAVYNQNSFFFRQNRDVAYYLQLAGGPNRNADRRYSFVIRADGSVVSRPTVKSAFGVLASNPFPRLQLNPGDTIVIPDKTLRPTALRSIMDWTQVFSQLALGAAAINVL